MYVGTLFYPALLLAYIFLYDPTSALTHSSGNVIFGVESKVFSVTNVIGLMSENKSLYSILCLYLNPNTLYDPYNVAY